MSSLAICPDCGGEYPVHMSRTALGLRVEGRCPNCGRDRSYTRFDRDEEAEPELIQDGWLVKCYEEGDDEHISHEWDEPFKTEDEAREYARRMKAEHISAQVLPRMVAIE